MPHSVEITDAAMEDIDRRAIDLVRHSQSIDLGWRFYEAVDRTIFRVAEAPERRPLSIYRPAGNEALRHRLIDGFDNDVLLYEHDETTVVVLRVLHGAMDLPTILES